MWAVIFIVDTKSSQTRMYLKYSQQNTKYLLQTFKYKYLKTEAFVFNAAKYKIIFVFLTSSLGFDFACYNGERQVEWSRVYTFTGLDYWAGTLYWTDIFLVFTHVVDGLIGFHWLQGACSPSLNGEHIKQFIKQKQSSQDFSTSIACTYKHCTCIV